MIRYRLLFTRTVLRSFTCRWGIYVWAMAPAKNFPRNFAVSNIRCQPLVIREFVHAAIFGFDPHLQLQKMEIVGKQLA